MKYLILLFTFLSTVAFGQVDNFDIVNEKIKWEKVYYTKDSFENILNEWKERATLENIQNENQTVTLSFKELPIDYKGAGKPYISLTDYLASSWFFGKAKIEFKDNRYRVTITDIAYQYKPSGLHTYSDRLNELEKKAYSMNTSSFSSRFRKDAYIINFTFEKLFNTKNTFENKEW